LLQSWLCLEQEVNELDLAHVEGSSVEEFQEKSEDYWDEHIVEQRKGF
jgi:hypothetical protein